MGVLDQLRYYGTAILATKTSRRAEATGTNGRPDVLGGRAPALASGPITSNLVDYAPPT